MLSERKISEIICEKREAILSPYAFREANSRGREVPMSRCDVRGEFQRDRDRIIHAKSFRRLMHKTQVFLAPEGEHYRTRLTHTLEVTQIARTIARSLFLNEDLCEAAALGHDLGHTPFGHIGEKALKLYCMPGFTHYEQSLRVVEKIEKLNLTYEVRDGILNHQGDHLASTLEGRVVKFADRIAYINHDMDDAVRAGILSEKDIPDELHKILGANHSARINTMVKSIVVASFNKNTVEMQPDIKEATDKLRDFLFERVYYNRHVLAEEQRAMNLIVKLFEYFVKHPEEMPELYRNLCNHETKERVVTDFISGMTDRHAINIYKKLYIPNSWSGLN